MFNFSSAPARLIAKSLFTFALTTVVVGWSVSNKATEIAPSRDRVIAKLSSAEMTDLVQQVHQQINQYRSSLDLDPLVLNDRISYQAKIHSKNMAQQRVAFSHQGFEARIEALEGDISYRSAAENLAYNQGYSDPASRAVAGWIKSEGHRQNMIGNYNLTGIGVAKNQQGEFYFTQIFIKN